MTDDTSSITNEVELSASQERGRRLGEALELLRGDLTDEEAEQAVRAAHRQSIFVSGGGSAPV